MKKKKKLGVKVQGGTRPLSFLQRPVRPLYILYTHIFLGHEFYRKIYKKKRKGRLLNFFINISIQKILFINSFFFVEVYALSKHYYFFYYFIIIERNSPNKFIFQWLLYTLTKQVDDDDFMDFFEIIGIFCQYFQVFYDFNRLRIDILSIYFKKKRINYYTWFNSANMSCSFRYLKKD